MKNARSRKFRKKDLLCFTRTHLRSLSTRNKNKKRDSVPLDLCIPTDSNSVGLELPFKKQSDLDQRNTPMRNGERLKRYKILRKLQALCSRIRERFSECEI